MSDTQMLIDMGFDLARVEYALKATNNKGLEAAMEWLLAHADDPVPATTTTTEATGSEQGGSVVGTAETPSADSDVPSSSTEQAKSLKCEDCGKLCRDHAEMEFHAAKTGHSNFCESTEEKKPLTEEEKEAQRKIIEERLRQKRAERAEMERKDALEREKSRIKSGKDMTEARKRLEDIEMKKIVDQRKREKAEEKAARDRVRAQIEADKAARKAREQSQKEPADSSAAVSSTTPTSPTTSVAAKAPPKDYTQTRIQVRLQDGSTLTETFNIKEQLSAVRVFIQMKTETESPFGLMTSFPRKIFADEDYEKPLDILGLVPSAVLIMTKAL